MKVTNVALNNLGVFTLPETNELHLKMDGWKTSFLLGSPIFRGYGYVSFRVFTSTNSTSDRFIKD